MALLAVDLRTMWVSDPVEGCTTKHTKHTKKRKGKC